MSAYDNGIIRNFPFRKFLSVKINVILFYGSPPGFYRQTIYESTMEDQNMEKSTVYFTDFRCHVGTSQLDKLKKLCVAAGIKNIDMDGKFVAIKMHFGELGNLAFLRPNYAKAVADLCKEQGGMPFLTDCNTLYPGSRKNALDHLDCANLNGFNPISTGCQIIIGDGLRGTDEVEVPVVNGEYCKTSDMRSWTLMYLSA